MSNHQEKLKAEKGCPIKRAEKMFFEHIARCIIHTFAFFCILSGTFENMLSVAKYFLLARVRAERGEKGLALKTTEEI